MINKKRIHVGVYVLVSVIRQRLKYIAEILRRDQPLLSFFYMKPLLVCLFQDIKYS